MTYGYSMRFNGGSTTVTGCPTQREAAAGPIRNSRMLREGKPDLVLAFPGHGGTADMVKQAGEAGVGVMKAERG